MDLGGIKQSDRPRVFLLSSTHGGEAHTLAAARAVIRAYRTQNVIQRQRRLVATVAEGLRSFVVRCGLNSELEIHASPWRVVVVCRDADGAVSTPFRTLLMQEMIGRGVLFQGIFLPCFMHTDHDVGKILEAFGQSCEVYRHALRYGLDGLLIGEPTRPVFRKYVDER
jgi:glutamate-1-semialdehyde aminotransferase